MSRSTTFFGKKKKSANDAKDRLKLLLIHDRTDLPQGVMDDLRDELIEVISRHINIDPNAVRIDVVHEGRDQRILAEIPMVTVNRRRGR
jgi:cell division topological specificity factor